MAPLLPFEQVIFQTLKPLCEALGFDYHIMLVNVDNPEDRHWSASDTLSSLQVVSDFSAKGSKFADSSVSRPALPSAEYPRSSESTSNECSRVAVRFVDGEVVGDAGFDEFDDDLMTYDSFVKREIDDNDEEVLIDSDEDTTGEPPTQIVLADQVVAPAPSASNFRHHRLILAERCRRRGIGDRSRKRMSMKSRLEVVNYIERGNKQIQAAKHFGISRGTVSGIWKDREKLRTHARNGINLEQRCSRISRFSAIDEPLRDWFHRMRLNKVPIAGCHIQDEALKIAENLRIEGFIASDGWLERFKQRYNIKLKGK